MSWVRATALVVAAAATVLIGAAPVATAVPGDPEPQHLLLLGQSERGPWSPTWTGSLFGGVTDLLTPGDAVEDSFYVFNNTGTKGRLTMTCWAIGDNSFAESLKFHFGNEAASLDCTAEATELGFDVPGRKSRRVTVSITFPSETRDGMDQTASSRFTLTLSQLPPKGGKPQVLGSQTVLIGSEPASTSPGAEDTTTVSSQMHSTPDSAAPAGKRKPAKTTQVAATLPQNGAVTESLPLIGGLLIAGALLAGFRRRRPEPD